MTDDIYMIAIASLLPLTASMVLIQTNPYHALVIRGILGALAALVYALFGAADVALTEALVGTMLSITLYAIAVRSSMRMRLGVLEPEADDAVPHQPALSRSEQDADLLSKLRSCLQPHHVNLEIVAFNSPQEMKGALFSKDLHGILLPTMETEGIPYELQVRLQRLAEIFQPDLPSTIAALTVVDVGTATEPSDDVALNPGVSR